MSLNGVIWHPEKVETGLPIPFLNIRGTIQIGFLYEYLAFYEIKKNMKESL